MRLGQTGCPNLKLDTKAHVFDVPSRLPGTSHHDEETKHTHGGFQDGDQGTTGWGVPVPCWPFFFFFSETLRSFHFVFWFSSIQAWGPLLVVFCVFHFGVGNLVVLPLSTREYLSTWPYLATASLNSSGRGSQPLRLSFFEILKPI